jgi:hypothetical protein
VRPPGPSTTSSICPTTGSSTSCWTGSDIGLKNVTRPLALAVEVLSQSTRRKDHVLKYSKYANSDVESYWIVDPAGPSVVAFDLIDRAYVEVATAQSTEVFSVAKPYPVSFVPDDLLDL